MDRFYQATIFLNKLAAACCSSALNELAICFSPLLNLVNTVSIIAFPLAVNSTVTRRLSTSLERRLHKPRDSKASTFDVNG